MGTFKGYRFTLGVELRMVEGDRGELVSRVQIINGIAGSEERYKRRNTMFVNAASMQVWMGDASSYFRHMMIGDGAQYDEPDGCRASKCSASFYRKFPFVYFTGDGHDVRMVEITPDDRMLIAAEAARINHTEARPEVLWMEYWIRKIEQHQVWRGATIALQIERVTSHSSSVVKDHLCSPSVDTPSLSDH